MSSLKFMGYLGPGKLPQSHRVCMLLFPFFFSQIGNVCVGGGGAECA